MNRTSPRKCDAARKTTSCSARYVTNRSTRRRPETITPSKKGTKKSGRAATPEDGDAQAQSYSSDQVLRLFCVISSPESGAAWHHTKNAELIAPRHWLH